MSLLPQANLDGHLAGRVFQDVTISVTTPQGTLTAVQTSPDELQTLVIGGLEENIAYQLFFRKNDLTVPFVIGQIFTVVTTKMRVVGIKTSPDGNLIACQMSFAKER